MEKEQQKARFFGMHIGCLFTHPDFEEPQILKGVAEYPDGTFNYDRIGSCFYKDGWVDIERCKLILRPLSALTDVEVLNTFLKAGLYGVYITRDNDKISVTGYAGAGATIWIKTSPFTVGKFIEPWNLIAGKEPPDVFEYMAVDYLRSIGIYLPWLGLNPEKEGWAIIEETK